MHVLFSAAAVIACPLQTTYCHGSDSLILDTKTVHSKEDKGKLQSWTNSNRHQSKINIDFRYQSIKVDKEKTCDFD